MTTQLLSIPVFEAFANNGLPLAGGMVYTYAAGTTTPQASYTDSTGSIPNSNPVVLDSRGSANIWLTPGQAYKINVTDASGNQIPRYPVDNVYGVAVLTQASIGIVFYPQNSYEITAGIAPTNYYYNYGDIRRYGADVTGSINSAPAINAAVSVATAAGGGFVNYPAGIFLINSTINDVAYVTHQGAGIDATTVKTTQNIACFTRAGSATVVINAGGIRDMTIHGSWAGNNSNSNNYGISCIGSNGAIYENLRIKGCITGFYGAFNFESFLDTIKVIGAGADLNSVGFVFDYTNLVNVNNAMYVTNCGAIGTQSDGWQLRNANGSLFSNCEAEACGGFGFNCGSSANAGYVTPFQFVNFVDCVGDTCTSANFFIQGTASLPASDLLFSNCWSGLTSSHNWVFLNCLNTIFTGNNGISAAQNAIYIEGGDAITVVGFVGYNCNTSNSGYSGININNSNNNIINGCAVNTNYGTGDIAENGSSSNNLITGNRTPDGIQILSSSTLATSNLGYNPIAKTVGSLTTTQAWPTTANTFGCPIMLNATGGTISSVTMGGVTLATATGFNIVIPPGQQIIATFTGGPVFTYWGL